MSEMESAIHADPPIALEININHRYKADEMGVIEFRCKNETDRTLKTLDLELTCPCEKTKVKNAALKNLAPSIEKRMSFQFEPGRGGEALLEVRIRCEDANRDPLVFHGQTSVTIASKNDGSSSHTSFTLDIHDIEKFMGNDLSELLGGAGKDREIDPDRLHERMGRKEPFWMRVDLDWDETETARLRNEARKILTPSSGQLPSRSQRALLASLNPASPRRIFIYSMPQVVFGREPQRSDAVLQFLPDAEKDPRSSTISAEQFVARYGTDHCVLAMAPKGHALMAINHKVLGKEEIPIAPGTEIKIGSCELALRIACMAPVEDAQWQTTRGEIFRSDPAENPYHNSPWDWISFSRPANGLEEEYLWLLAKIDIGWEPSGLQIGRPQSARARLMFWNGRYYLEALGGETQIRAAGAALQPGKIACLDTESELGFGPHRFLWRLQ